LIASLIFLAKVQLFFCLQNNLKRVERPPNYYFMLYKTEKLPKFILWKAENYLILRFGKQKICIFAQ